jgi:hypothetical protein
VITRSWEPWLTLATDVKPNGQTENSVSVGWSACATKDKKDLTSGCKLYRRIYSDDGRWEIEQVTGGGGCAYLNDLILVAPQAYKPDLGYVDIPKVFINQPTGGYKHWLQYPTTENSDAKRQNGEVWFWYVDRLPESSDEDIKEEEGVEGIAN